MTAGRPLAAKLFLEGIEVPFIGATLTHTVNQASIAYIDLVPHATINNIKPRTMVQLFVRDFNDFANGFPYVLAFEGEVFGYAFGKTPTSRTFSISCIDFSSYWDNVLAYFFNAQQSLGKGAGELSAIALDRQDAIKQGQKTVSTTHSVSAYFIQVMKSSIDKAKKAGLSADFIDGLVGVIQDIGNVNDFYLNAEERLRIADRIRLKSSGELDKLLKQTEALEWFQGIIGRNTGYSTLRMIVNDLLSILFHDFVSIPFPAAVESKSVKKSVIEGAVPAKTIGEFLFKPNLYMMPPPACNVFFPDEYSSFNFNRNFFQEPTRLIYKPEMPSFQNGTGSTALLHVYEPASFSHFMKQGTKTPYPTDTVGAGDVQITQAFSKTVGKFGDKDPGNKTNQGKKREQQFLTNEERLRGILMTQEAMVPATMQFRQALSEVGKQTFAQGVAKYLFYKKRFQGRDCQITSHLKMSVVPGFPVMILDDSDAEQTVIAYCSSVTHRIYATQGGYTNTTLSYARSVAEQDTASSKAGEPLIPPWFSKAIFGEKKKATSTNKKAKKKVEDAGEQIVVPAALSTFYAELLGDKGSSTINLLMKEDTMLGASIKLVEAYRTAKKNRSVSSLIDSTTSRRYIKIQDAFKFLSAETSTKDMNLPFLEFTGARISGQTGGDADQIKARRDVVTKYRDALKTKRGFRG